MKKCLLIAIISFMIAGFNSCGNNVNEKERQDFFKSQVELLNETCPIEFGDFMTMEKAIAMPNYTIKICSTLDLDPELCANIDKDLAKQGAISGLKMDPGFDLIKKYELSYLYEYRNADGQFLYDLLITPEDYK